MSRRWFAGAKRSQRRHILSQYAIAQKLKTRFGHSEFVHNQRRILSAPMGMLSAVSIVLSLLWPHISLDIRPQISSHPLAVSDDVLHTQEHDPSSLYESISNEFSDEAEQGQFPAAFGEIVIVTPTPVGNQSAAEVEGSGSQIERRQQTPSSQSGVVRVGQPLPVRNLTPEATIDHAVIDELIAPLLQSQVQPTPMVIELEVPTNGRSSAGSTLSMPGHASAFPHVMLIPSPTPVTPEYSEVASVTNLPQVEIIPAVGVRFTPTPTPMPTVTPVPIQTALWSSNGPEVGRIWSSFQPLSPENGDHFWLENPFTTGYANDKASPSYQFGSTAGGRYRPHHGIDISNPMGTLVRAGANGEVVFAGPDEPEALGPYPNFYGNAVIIRMDRKLPVAGGRLDVYVLYGHLSEVLVEPGQRVEADDVVGRVGMEGIAIGPHLHVEIRLGANTYAHNVNPYLWLEPKDGNGTVAVRLVTDDGRTWAGVKVSLARFVGGKAIWARQIETYLDVENIGPDPAWGENGAMGDVPAGYYYLISTVNGQSIREEFEILPGQTTFVEVRTE